MSIRLAAPDSMVATWVRVTHDVSEAVAIADRVILIEDGQVGLDLTVDLQRPLIRGLHWINRNTRCFAAPYTSPCTCPLTVKSIRACCCSTSRWARWMP